MQFRNICCSVTGLCLAFSAWGCGSGKYEERLQNASKYYAFVDEQNSNLANTWTGNGVSLRLPLQMKILPAPKVELGKDGNPQPIDHDPRQPEFVHLSGLQAAWKTEIAAQEGNTIPAYFYILSNRDLWAVEDGAEAATNFTENALKDIATSIQVEVPDSTHWQYENFPKSKEYQQQNRFRSLTLKPQKPLLGTSTNLRIYRLEQGGYMQTLLVYAIPRGIEEGQNRDSDQLMQRIGMSLATLWINPDRPQPSRGGGGGGTSTSATPF